MKNCIYLLIVLLHIFSCKSDKEIKKEEFEKVSKSERDVLNSKIQEYSPVIKLNDEYLKNKYSFELEELLIQNEKIVVFYAEILDIEKINENSFVLNVNGRFHYPEITHKFILKVDKKIVSKIISFQKNTLLSSYEETYKFFFFSKITKLNFIDFVMYPYVSDYRLQDGELEEYEIDIDLEKGGFLFYGECIDIVNASIIDDFD